MKVGVGGVQVGTELFNYTLESVSLNTWMPLHAYPIDI